MTIRIDDGAKEIIERPGEGVVLGSHTSVPADGEVGYAHGSLFLNTDGTTGNDAIYCNIGTLASANFDAIEVTGTSFITDTIAEATAAAGVTIDGVQLKDYDVVLHNTLGRLDFGDAGETYFTGGAGGTISVYLGSAEDFRFTVDTFTVLAGSSIAFAAGANISLATTTGTKIGTATTQLLGFYNKTPVDQPAALTTQLTSITHTAPGTPDYALQNLVQNTGFGFVTADEGNTTLSVILNLQTRLAEVEARLEELGLVAAN